MAGDKYLMAAVGCRNQKAVLPVSGKGFAYGNGEELPFLSFTEACSHSGLDGLCVFDLSESEEDHEKTIHAGKEEKYICPGRYGEDLFPAGPMNDTVPPIFHPRFLPIRTEKVLP